VDPVAQPDSPTPDVGAIRASRITSRTIENVVEVDGLVVRYGRGDRGLTAVDGVSFSARAGQV